MIGRSTALAICIERLINRLKHFRRVATRYEKRAENYRGDAHASGDQDLVMICKQTLVKNKKRAGELRKNERKYLLSGFVRCGIYGYACNGRTSTSRVSGSPKKYAYYSCASNRAYPGGGAPPTALLASPPTG